MQQQHKESQKRKAPVVKRTVLFELIKQLTALIIALTGLVNILVRVGTILKWW